MPATKAFGFDVAMDSATQAERQERGYFYDITHMDAPKPF